MKYLIAFLVISITFFYSADAFSQDFLAKYTIKNIKVNSKSSDYGVSFFGPNRVYFASNKSDSKSGLKSFGTTYEAPNYDLYKGLVMQSGELEYVEKVDISTITKYNESNAAFTPDMKYVYFTLNNVVDGKSVQDSKGNVNMKIFRANVNATGTWSNVISLPFNSDDYSCTHPSVSEDGKILFFASDMPGSYGASDLYWVTINSNASYGTPQNLGNNINSEYRENFPYVDGNILYFSSDRQDSKGGLDVYMVRLDELGSMPQNLGTPINSKYDDFSFVIDREHKRGFFTSNRPGGKGEDDIYYFTQDTDFQECKQTITGIILDENTKRPIAGAIVTMYSHENILLAKYPVKEDGTFKFELACRGNYQVHASHSDYNETSQEINFTPQIFSQDLTLYLKPKPKVIKEEPKTEPIVEVSKKETIVKEPGVVEKTPVEIEIPKTPTIMKDGNEILDLPPVYFDLDQYYITRDAETIIRRAINILNQHPEYKIEFESHTDCRASASYNLHLSEMRAREVVNFMIQEGISTDRITGRGYGESKPVNRCVDGVKCTEEEHLQNRRAEFVLIKK